MKKIYAWKCVLIKEVKMPISQSFRSRFFRPPMEDSPKIVKFQVYYDYDQ